MAELFPTPRSLPHNEAHLSPCGLYRWRLWRAWGKGTRQVCFVMLNPSTADATFNDPTMKRVIALSKSWGFDGLVVVNVHPYRTSDPRQLPPLSPVMRARNTALVRCSAAGAEMVIAAWGNGGDKIGAPALVGALPSDLKLYCLGTTMSGAPKHPLARGKHRVPEGTRPQLWARP